MNLRRIIGVPVSAAAVAVFLPLAGHATSPGPGLAPQPEPGTRPCFIQPPRWNVALDGPLPRCPAVTSATASEAGVGRTRPWAPVL